MNWKLPLPNLKILIQRSYQQSPLIEELLAQIRPKRIQDTFFFLPYRDGYRKINLEDIAFFYSHMTITYANLFNGEQVMVPQTLETLEQELRTHKISLGKPPVYPAVIPLKGS